MSDRTKELAAFMKLVEKFDLDREGINYICRRAKEKIPDDRQRKIKELPKVMDKNQLKAFFMAVEEGLNPQHEFMFKLLLSTGARVSELVGIKMIDIDRNLKHIKLLGKGGKERVVPYPESLAAIMRYHLTSHDDNLYLFERNRRNSSKLSTRYIQGITKTYVQKAGLPAWITPHTFRHQFITMMSAAGMPQAKLKVLSGHSTTRALEIYQSLTLAGGVEDQYHKIMGEVFDG